MTSNSTMELIRFTLRWNTSSLSYNRVYVDTWCRAPPIVLCMLLYVCASAILVQQARIKYFTQLIWIIATSDLYRLVVLLINGAETKLWLFWYHFTVPLAFNSINLYPFHIPKRHFSIMESDIPIFLFVQPIDTFVSSVALYVFNLKTGLVSRSPRSTINHPVDDRALPIVYSERHRAAVLMTSPNQGKKCIFIHSGLDVQRSPRLHCFIMAVLWRSTLASEQVPSWFNCYY